MPTGVWHATMSSPHSPEDQAAGLRFQDRIIPCAHSKQLAYRGFPLVMGILNVTPDSFSDGGRFATLEGARQRAQKMISEGVDLIDVGGESTRPGASFVPLEEELQRVIPVVERLARILHVPISVDTHKAEVARQSLDVGACLINDVTAFRGDSQMISVIVRAKAAVILMHMRGTPQTMQDQPRYGQLVPEISGWLSHAAQQAEVAGVERSRILIDPGLGFGKTLEHNLQLMRGLDAFVALGYPVVVGPSRKSFIGKTLDLDVEDRLAGTLACVAYAQLQGVHIVRVHDVPPAVQVIQMIRAIEESQGSEKADALGCQR